MTQNAQQLLLQLMDNDLIDLGRIKPAADLIINTAITSLNVSRAGFWLYESERHDALISTLIIDKTQQSRDTTTRLKQKEFPLFFDYLATHTLVQSNQVRLSNELNELQATYITPNNIESILIVPVRVKAKKVGIFVCETTNFEKRWSKQDIFHATLLADYFSRCLAAADVIAKNKQLQTHTQQFNSQSKHLKALHDGLNHFSLMITTDKNGTITDINDNFLKLSGYERSELIGQPQTILNSLMYSEDYFQLMERLLNQGISWRGRLCNKKKNGELFWLDATISPLINKQKVIEGYIGFHYEVTTEVETEQQLIQSQQLARLGSFRLNLSDELWHCSDQLHQILSIPKSETITSEDFEHILAPEFQSIFKTHFDQIKRSTHSHNFKVKTKGLPERWFNIAAKRQGSWVIGSIQDISKLVEKDSKLKHTIAFQNAIFDAAHFTVIATTTDGTITHFNRTAEKLLGYKAEEVIGVETPAIFHDPDELAEAAHQLSIELGKPIAVGFESLVARAQTYDVEEKEWTYLTRNGSDVPISLSISTIRNEQGGITGYLGVGKDLTKLKYAEQQTARLDTILATAGDLAHFGGFQYNVEEDRLHLTHHDLQQVLSPTKSAVHLADAIALVHPEHRDQIQDAFNQAIQYGHDFDITLKILNPSQDYDWVRMAGTAHLKDQRVHTLLGFVHTINEQKRLEHQLSQLAMTDELTGLNNRRALIQSLSSEWHRHQRYQTDTTLLILDIDFFKQVNDQWGHDVGDHVLTEFSKRIQQQLRSSDCFGRLGGEEFLIIAPNNTEQATLVLAEKLRLSICKTPFTYHPLNQDNSLSIPVTVSIGIAGLSTEIETQDQWLVAADTALYHSKSEGRNQVTLYNALKSSNSTASSLLKSTKYSPH
jgi:diguanylate cyclase (GGDEF)-like protein/PAS domain S-box-containing protein